MLNDKRNNSFNRKEKGKWVPKSEEEELEEIEKQKQSFLLLMEESEKRWQQQQRQQQEQEEKKKKEKEKEVKVYSPLPSNYVSLAQLKERWMMKQQSQKREEEEKKVDYPPLQQRHVEVMASTSVNVSRLNIIERNLRGKRVDSADNRCVIGVESDEKMKSMIGAGFSDHVERNRGGNRDGLVNSRRVIGVESEVRGKSVTGAVIADNASVSRLNPVERNRGGKREESGDNRRGISVESEDGRKSVIGTGIEDGKGDLVSEVQESKTKKKKNKISPGRRSWKRAMEEGSTAPKGNEVAEKTSLKIESNEVKNMNSKTVEEEAEHKFRVLSLNSGDGKQNLNFRKMNYGFRDSQSLRNNRNGGGCGRGGGRGNSKMIWVKKDESVGEIEP